MRVAFLGAIAVAAMVMAAPVEQRPPEPGYDQVSISLVQTMESPDLARPDSTVMSVQEIKAVGVIEVRAVGASFPLEYRGAIMRSRSRRAIGYQPTFSTRMSYLHRQRDASAPTGFPLRS